MLKLSDLSLGVLTAALSALLLAYSSNFPALPGQAYGAGTMPRLLGYAGIALGLVIGAQGLMGSGRPFIARRAEWTRSGRAVLAVLAIVAVVLFYILFVDMVGFIPSAVVVMVVPMLVLRVHPLLALGVAIAAAFFVRYAFGQLLLVPLPSSPLIPFFG